MHPIVASYLSWRDTMVSHFLYTDESTKKGRYFNNFYGGLLVPSDRNEALAEHLRVSAKSVGLTSEIKWQKISLAYQDRYIAFIDSLFDAIPIYDIKIRIMFTHNYKEAVGLTKEQRDNQYFLLYYQFIKHAFGFRWAPFEEVGSIALRLDQLPDKFEKCQQFKQFISNMSVLKQFRDSQIDFPAHLMSEIDSSKHIQSQALDVVLGAMQFRLNDKHKEKPAGQYRRGSRTRAKEKVYRHVNARICRLKPNFNIGVSTGKPNGMSDLWEMPYRHWCFEPREHRINVDAKK